MALNKWDFDEKMSTQITNQNANLDEIDTHINTIKTGIGEVGRLRLSSTTVARGDYLEFTQENYSKFPIGTSINQVSINGVIAIAICQKSSDTYLSILYFANTGQPTLVQKNGTNINKIELGG